MAEEFSVDLGDDVIDDLELVDVDEPAVDEQEVDIELGEMALAEEESETTASTQETEYLTPMSSLQAPARTDRRTELERRLNSEKMAWTHPSSGPDVRLLSSNAQTFPPPRAALAHPNPSPTRATPLLSGPPPGTPTAPRKLRRPPRPKVLQQDNITRVSDSSHSNTAPPPPQQSTSRAMIQQNAAAFLKFTNRCNNEQDLILQPPSPTASKGKKKAAEPTIPEPEYPMNSMLWQPRKTETVADQRRRVEQNAITLEGQLRTVLQRLEFLEGSSSRPLPAPEPQQQPTTNQRSMDDRMVDIVVQQMETQKDLMKEMMGLVQQQRGLDRALPPFSQPTHILSPPRVSRPRWKRSRSESPNSSSSDRYHPRRRRDSYTRSPSTSLPSTPHRSESPAGSPHVHYNDPGSMQVDPSSRLPSPSVENPQHGDLECSSPHPADTFDATQATRVEDRPGGGIEEDKLVGDGLQGQSLLQRLSIPLLERISTERQLEVDMVDDMAHIPQRLPLADRLGVSQPLNANSTYPSTSRWNANPHTVVHLGDWHRRFSREASGNAALLDDWCERIAQQHHNVSLPRPWSIGTRHHGRALRLIFNTATEARSFVESWNTYRACITVAAQLVAGMNVQAPVPCDPVSTQQDDGTSFENENDFGHYYCRVLSWNVAGKLETILNSDNFRREMEGHDVLMLQETHHYDGEPAPNLDGYTVFSRARTTEDFNYPWGGVITWVKSELKPTLVEEMCSADILVVQVGGLLYFNTYLPPQNSRRDWSAYTDMHPLEALEAALTLAAGLGLPFVIGGDLNARTASRIPTLTHPARFSVNSTSDTRGAEILRFCASNEMTILNGSVGIEGNHSNWTSHQKKTDSRTGTVHYACAVVDYFVCSVGSLPWIRSLEVSERTPWSDHSFLSLSMLLEGEGLPWPTRGRPTSGNRRTKPKFSLPMETELDRMFDTLMNKPPKTEDEKLVDIYGRVRIPDPNVSEVHVYTDGSCIGDGNNRRAGAGLFYGHNSQLNRSYRVPGPQTNSRAELFAIYAAVVRAPKHRTLKIYTDSEYAIKSLTHWAPKRAACGWECQHGDLLQKIVVAIKARAAPLHFRWVRGHSGNVFNENADRLTKEGARNVLPLQTEEDLLEIATPIPPQLQGEDLGHTDELVVTRVQTNLPVDWPEKKRVTREKSYSQTAHRGRSLRRQRQNNLLRRLVDSADHPKKFWALYKKLRYPKSQTAEASMEQLMDVFIPQMNPPSPEKMGFDEGLLQQYKDKSAQRPYQTEPSRFASMNLRPTPADVEMLKAYLDARKHSDTTGVDNSAYSMLMDMDNSDICALLDKCFESSDVPGAWLTTLIKAIPKVGKDTSDPMNYRAIALESCFLKFATLFVHMKFTYAAEEAGIIPASQNGFRQGFRTQNNGFILRSIIEKSRAAGETLYVAFVDISNAFPSTNQDVLWDRLEKFGLTGRYFDWMRAIYGRMRYMIDIEGQLSPEFQAQSGVLIGDPASPVLWNLFLAAFRLMDDVDDVELEGTRISHLEHADDLVIVSRSAEGLQRHLNELQKWCKSNFLELSPTKSKVMIFGPLPTQEGGLQFAIAGKNVVIVKEYKYVGIEFTSVEKNIFARCYMEKARKARASGFGIFGTDRLVGRRRLPPGICRTLYSALVDCHLIFGCEVIIDVDNKGLTELFDVQKKFLRRMLGLSSKSTIPGLFTETALLPLQARRIILALRYLLYMIKRMRLEIEQDKAPSFTSLALRANIRMRESGKPCWLMDLDWVLQRLPGSDGKLKLPMWTDVSEKTMEDLVKRVSATTCRHLQQQLDENHKLTLLSDRVEPVNPNSNSTPRRRILWVRHYLTQIQDHRHRVLVTRLILGDIIPSVFRARPGKTYTQTDNWRFLMCRGCGLHYETPEHVIFRCAGDVEVARMRLKLIRQMEKRWRDSGRTYQTDPLLVLKRCIFDWDFVRNFASALFDIVRRWREVVKSPAKIFEDDMTDGESESDMEYGNGCEVDIRLFTD